jgi:hypothetical protein
LTVTTVGSRVSWDNNKSHPRNSRTSNASVIVAPGGGDNITSPPKVLLMTRLPSHVESEHEHEGESDSTRARPVSGLPGGVDDGGVVFVQGGGAELARTETVDFAEKTVGRIYDL